MATQKPIIINPTGQMQRIQTGDTLDPEALGTGTVDGTKFLRDDGTWAAPSASAAQEDVAIVMAIALG